MALPQVCNACFNLETVLHINLGRSAYVNTFLEEITNIGEIIDTIYDDVRPLPPSSAQPGHAQGSHNSSAVRGRARGTSSASRRRRRRCRRRRRRRWTTWSRG